MCRALILGVFFLAVGCIPHSEHPLTDPHTEPIDSAILGSWYYKDENEHGFVHLGLEYKTGLLNAVMVEFKKNGDVELSEYSGHTSRLGGNKYMNLKWVHREKEIPGFIFVKYSTSGDSLILSLMETQAVEDAIRDGSLKGVIERQDRWSSSVRVTEEQKKLQTFVLKKDRELFKESAPLRRLDLPAGRPFPSPESAR